MNSETPCHPAFLVSMNTLIGEAVFERSSELDVPGAPTAAIMCSEGFEDWRGQVEMVVFAHTDRHLGELASMPPLVECHQLGMNPLEVYLWHVLEPSPVEPSGQGA